MRTSRVRGRTITRATFAATPIFFFIAAMSHIIQLKIIQVIDVNASSLSPSYIHHHDSHHHRRHEINKINKIKQTQLKPIPKPIPKPKPKPAPITASPLPLSNHRILILPGFFHTQKQYQANHEHDHYRDHDSNTYNPKKSSSLEQSLIKEHGWKQNQIKVLPIKFLDWIQVFTKGVIDYKFWIGTTTPTSPAFKWYLDYIKVEIEKFYIDFENEKKEKRMMICDNGDGNGNGNDDNHEKKMEEELILINKEQKYCSDNSNDNGNDKTMYDDNDDGNNDHDHHDVDNDNNDDEKLKIILIGHSAGGWLARAALGFMLDQEQEGAAGIGTVSTNNDHDYDHDYDHNGRQIEKETKKGKNIDLLSCVCGVVTLGSPHTSPKHDCLDITRGALRKTNERFPGAYYAPKIFYISVIGDAIKGKKQKQKQQSTTKKQFPATLFDFDLYNLNLNHVTSLEGFAYESYSKVCGNGNEVGDGVVPCCAGHIDGGTHITLDGVQHSHTFPGDWYGSPNVIDSWHDVMLNQIMSSNAKDAHEKE